MLLAQSTLLLLSCASVYRPVLAVLFKQYYTFSHSTSLLSNPSASLVAIRAGQSHVIGASKSSRHIIQTMKVSLRVCRQIKKHHPARRSDWNEDTAMVKPLSRS